MMFLTLAVRGEMKMGKVTRSFTQSKVSTITSMVFFPKGDYKAALGILVGQK